MSEAGARPALALLVATAATPAFTLLTAELGASTAFSSGVTLALWPRSNVGTGPLQRALMRGAAGRALEHGILRLRRLGD